VGSYLLISWLPAQMTDSTGLAQAARLGRLVAAAG